MAEPTQPAGAAADHAYLTIEGVTKAFGDFRAVDNVSLTIPRREIFALLGSSGSGKSTLLRMLAGMETPTEGKIILDGEDISALPTYRRPVNMMFQSYALFPHMTVEQNVGFGLKQDKVPKDEIADRVAKLLDLVQIRKLAKRKPHQLSGGQQQRTALARSLAKSPKLLLLDEPLGALDKKLRMETQLELVNVIQSVGVTCILVTHDQEEAMTMANRIAVMSEGKLVQVGGSHEIYEYPNCRFTAQFIGQTNLFEGTVVESAADHVVIDSVDFAQQIFVSHGITPTKGSRVWSSVRPERVGLSRTAPDSTYNWCQGTVHEIAYLGTHSVYHVKLANGRKVMAHVPTTHWGDETPVGPGEPVIVRWPNNANVVLTS